MARSPVSLHTGRGSKAVHLLGLGVALAILPALIHNSLHERWAAVITLAIEEALVVFCLVLNQKGLERAASMFLSLSSVALAGTLTMTSRHGVHDVAMLIFPGAIVVSGALLDRRWFVVSTSACMATIALQYGLELTGVHKTMLSQYVELRLLIDTEVIVLVTALAVGVLVGNLRNSLVRAQRAADLLAESETRYRTLFESVNDAIFVYDPESLALVDANRRACELYGYDLKSLCHLTVSDLGTNEPGHALQEVARALAPTDSGKFQLFEWRAKNRAGRVFWVEASMRRAVLMGQTRLLVSVRDIDDRKRAAAEKARLEERLQQVQKLESIGRLAGGIAHDFNNLLTCILVNVDGVLEQVQSNDSLRDMLGEIRHAGRRAADLTGQLLAFSRRQTIAPRLIDVANLLATVHRMLQRVLTENIQLTMESAPDIGVIRADPGQVEQILVNLAINARDAMPHGGHLDIRAINRSIDDEYCAKHPNVKVGDYVCISVEDSGAGMDDDTQEHLFEPFFTTKPIGKGTGLGLAMVFGAIQQNKGFVSVKSAVGRGSVFSLYFPRCSEVPEQLTDSAQQFINLGGTERVLVVEDDDSVRKLAVKILRGFGYEAVACRNAEEAMVVAQRDRFDLLLTDVILPGENGRQLALRLNEQYPELKVLYCSGHSEDIIGKQGIIDQSLAFIPKPFTAQQLAYKLREVLDDKRHD